MIYLKQIFENSMIVTPLIAWGISQGIKIITNLVKNKVFDIKKAVADGGMPSGHAATMVSLTVSCGITEGLNSAAFAICSVLTVLIIRDSLGVRRESGKHAGLIMKLVDRSNASVKEGEEAITPIKLKPGAGHTMPQVLVGTAIGIVVSALYAIFF